jgi:uncharacterized protein YjaG (DUF416 family)
MKKQKNHTLILSLLILASTLFTACGPKTMEQQVETIMKSENIEERNTISCALADSLSIKPIELLLGLHSDPIAVDALQNMLTCYSKLIITKPNETHKALDCIRFIAEPSAQNQDDINQLKIDLIIDALLVDNLNINFENTLINAANQHGNIAMLKAIDTWYEKKRSSSLLNAIISFDNDAIAVLVSRIEKDTVAVDLLARFGQPVVNTMIKKMKDKDQSIRFAAGDVLVQMQKYDPDAINLLTSAIDEGGTRIIAKNYPFYIRLGQFGTEKLLLKALDIYFNQAMCVDYLNCGNTELDSGAKDIAEKHGYWVMPSFSTHGGPKWGSGN